VAARYELSGVSASLGQQEPELAEVTERIRAGELQVLVCVHSSRLDRREDLDAQVAVLSQIRAAGGRVESVREPQFGTSDLAGRIVTMVAQHANAEYSRTLSAHIMAGNTRLDQADRHRGKVPYGFTLRDGYLVPDPHAAAIVTGLYERCSQGYSLSQLAEWLETVHGIKKRAQDIAVCRVRSRVPGGAWRRGAGQPGQGSGDGSRVRKRAAR
jgi:DNA invertase Pin-like site-specific DNA recombinase